MTTGSTVRRGKPRRRSKGVAKAESEGRYKGRKPIPEDLRRDAPKLAAEGATRKALASQLGVGEATLYRILANQRNQKS